jgi:Uma2 family endonuclease
LESEEVFFMDVAKTEATIEDLYRVEGKAEIVNGEIISMSPPGFAPNYAAGEIFASLRAHAKRTGIGCAITDNMGFIVNLPKRKSFSPDAAFVPDKPTGMKFYEGATIFAVEVRSERDYGARVERAIREKIKDYFAAGTRVVWDMDLLSEDVVKKYVSDKPDEPQIFRRGEAADAEPAVPGWRTNVDDLFA